MKYSSPAREPRGHNEKKKIEQNLLESKHAGLTPFQITCSVDRPQRFPTAALGNASGFSYQRTNSSYTGKYQIVMIIYLPSQ